MMVRRLAGRRSAFGASFFVYFCLQQASKRSARLIQYGNQFLERRFQNAKQLCLQNRFGRKIRQRLDLLF